MRDSRETATGSDSPVSKGGVMRVRKRLPTRCLCVGLSFLAAATPVPAVAQEVLPSVAVPQEVFPLVAGVVHLVPSTRIRPLGLLAPSSRGDSVDIAIAEIQARSTSPGDVTQAPPVSEARAAVMAAEADAKRDISGAKWTLIGVAAGLYILPVITAYAVHPDPPAARLNGKTPEYTAFYQETWKDRSKARRVRHAWIGVGIFWAAAAGAVIVACNTGSGCAPTF
jgi:hypothetical protein